MRLSVLAAMLAFALIASDALAAPAAQIAFVERRGLLEADTQCHLFTPNVRAALQAGAGQARGALLRSGWTRARFDELEQAAADAGRERPCNDPRTVDAAAQARNGFNAWARATKVTFPGFERAWTAFRFPNINGWRVGQDIAPGVQFGVRDHGGAQHLTLLMPATAPAPASAQLVLRDPSRASTNLLELRGRTLTGLAAGAPSATSAMRILASVRRLEPADRFHPPLLAFEFPDTAFQAMLALDQREAVQIVVQGAQTRTFLIEVGDIAAARTFLTARASS